MLCPNELKKLVHQYQEGDYLAAECICQSFTPLVKRLAHRPYVYNSYGEDAENMLWLWLLEFLKFYKGDNFKKLPGLIRKHLIFKLMRSAEYNSKRWNAELITDFEDPKQVNRIEENDALQLEVLSLALKQVLQLLPSRQKEIICRFYLNQETQGEIAKSMHCSTRAIRKFQSAGMKTLRKNFIRS